MYTSSPDKPSNPQNKIRPKKKRMVRVIVVNCQSLKNKLALLQNLADSMKPDVIIGTESWLIPEHKEKGIFNSEIFPNGYIYRLSVARREGLDVPYYTQSTQTSKEVALLSLSKMK